VEALCFPDDLWPQLGMGLTALALVLILALAIASVLQLADEAGLLTGSI
jgi:hypothetical protein